MFFNLFFLLILGVCVSAQNTNNNDTNLELTILLKLHGIGMISAWCLILPFGISIALMCKSILPGKGYMFAHLTVMLLGVIIAFISLLLVLLHSEFTWLTTQSLNTPHQVIGLCALFGLVLNLIIAVFRPKEESKWRGLFNFAHGGTGIFLASIPAYITMLIAVHMLPAFVANDFNKARIVTILITALVGYVVFLLALYNIYPVRYHKDIPRPEKVPALIQEKQGLDANEENDFPQRRNYNRKIPLQSSPDAVCRVVVMAIGILPMIGLGVAAIVYVGILK